jgi:hypothetical protein
MQKKIVFFQVFLLLLCTAVAQAKETSEWLDEDGDGQKETQVFSSGNLTVRAEKDKNGDGKPDRTMWFRGGKRYKAEEDVNFDGRIDKWETYTAGGSLFRAEKDSNFDGKPDDFKKLLSGRDVVLKESDRNFDGKIDKRSLTQWDPNRRLAGQLIPSYRTLTREEDKDFDGKIDAYSERGKPEAAAAKIGQPMQPLPDTADPIKPDLPSGEAEVRGALKLIKEQNEKYGLDK